LLRTLRVYDTKITDDGDINHWGGLYWSYMKIGNVPIFIFEIKHLSSLETLVVFDTEITDAGLKHLSQLHTLHMSGILVTDDGLLHLTRLRALYAHNNIISIW
jgi:Leucine-rich repeat (LRR) protein